MELRVLPSVRKFKELGVTGAEDIPILEQIDQTPRSLNFLDSDAHESNKLILETGESSAKEG
jgi:hypothetical protein